MVRIFLTWNASAGATTYQVYRRDPGGSYALRGTTSSTSFPDTGAANTAYLYVVRAVNTAGSSPDSAPDLATTVTFTDDPLTPGTTPVRAVHVTELRAAINTLRTNTALYPTAQTGFTRGPNRTSIADTFAGNTSRMKTNFRERAFWMFSTGHRLGDMRRMVRQYAYPADSIYPRSSYYKGGAFGTALMLPVPFEEINNPNFTQCTNLDP